MHRHLKTKKHRLQNLKSGIIFYLELLVSCYWNKFRWKRRNLQFRARLLWSRNRRGRRSRICKHLLLRSGCRPCCRPCEVARGSGRWPCFSEDIPFGDGLRSFSGRMLLRFLLFQPLDRKINEIQQFLFFLKAIKERKILEIWIFHGKFVWKYPNM